MGHLLAGPYFGGFVEFLIATNWLVLQLGALVGGAANGTQPPTGRQDQPSAGIQRSKSSTHKVDFVLGSCTTSGLDLGSQHARQERALPIRSNPFLLPGGEYSMQTNADLLAAKDPGPAFEGIEERRKFLEKRSPYL
jgi:hypothetical protein